jgi:hypothetical protein
LGVAKSLWGAIGIMAGAAVGLVLGRWLGFHLGERLGTWLGARVDVLAQALAAVRHRAPLFGAFTGGYLLIAIWFAATYQLMWTLSPDAFSGLARDAGFVDFFYFSIVTVATLGYGDIAPKVALARLAVSIEVVIGITWTTIVVAALWSSPRSKPAEMPMSGLRKNAPVASGAVEQGAEADKAR